MKQIYSIFLIFSLITVTPYGYSSLEHLFGTTNRQIATSIKALAYSNKSVREAINDYFYKKEQALLKKIKIKFAITDSQWNEAHAEADNLALNDPLYYPTDMIAHDCDDHPFIVEARELIATYGMNPNCVLIRDSQETPRAQVVTTIVDDAYLTHTMDLNISDLETLDNAERILTVKHEIRHLWYADSLYSGIIESFMSYNRLDPLYIEYSKNQELRADIMAATDSLEDAFELYNWLSNCMPDDTDDFIHPNFSERLEAATQLHAYMALEAKHLSEL